MFSAISKTLLHLLGWKIRGRYPYELKKYLVIVMPHTSNWDFPLGALARSAVGADIRFLAKHTVFRPPFGWFFRWMGGYPVDRTRRNRLVDAVAGQFRREERLALAIAPEGTRKKVPRLRTGFYYIAIAAGIPMLLVRFDYGRREIAFSEPFYPSGDKDADFQYILGFFKDARGRHPEWGIDESVRY